MQRTTSPSTPSQTSDRDRTRMRGFNVAVGLAHLVQAGLMLALSNDLTLPVTATFLSGDPVTSSAAMPEILFEVPIGPVVALFLLLAAIDHLTVAARGVVGWYESRLDSGVNDARWVEYSLSASIMLVLIAMFTGVWSFAALVGFVGANTAMIWFGWLMERQQQPGHPDWSAFWFGTVAGLAPWIAIFVYIAGAGSAPAFVYAIIAIQFVLFSSFGVNQFLQYREVGRWRSYRFGEAAYIVLSLVAKSLLAWLIFANVLRT